MQDKKMILFRVTEAEKNTIKSASASYGISMREFIIQAVNEKLTSLNLLESQLNLRVSLEEDS